MTEMNICPICQGEVMLMGDRVFIKGFGHYAKEKTCKMHRDEIGIWHCESCENGGDNITGSNGELDMWYDSWHPNFCPNCGARVID